MSTSEEPVGVVEATIQDLLGPVNEGFNWDVVIDKYDNNPVGTALSIYFTDESGEEMIEEVHLGIAEGPEMVLLDELDPRWDYLGSIVTYQDYGLRILDPDDPMTPEAAYHQFGGIDIHPDEGESRARVWLVCREVLKIMLESIIWRKQEQEGQ